MKNIISVLKKIGHWTIIVIANLIAVPIAIVCVLGLLLVAVGYYCFIYPFEGEEQLMRVDEQNNTLPCWNKEMRGDKL